MSNILNKIQIQGNPTVTYDLLSSAIPCYGPYIDQSTGHITELYADIETLIFIEDKILNALYLDVTTGKLYSYIVNPSTVAPTPADYWFIPVAVETTQSTIPCYGCIYAGAGGVQNIRGLWLDEAHTKRTPEGSASDPIDENIVYQDRTTGARYTYKRGSSTEDFGGFVLISPITVMAETTTTTATINIPQEISSASANVYDVNIFTNDGASYSSITQEGDTNPYLIITFEEAPAEGSTRKVYCSFSQIWGYFA